MINNPILYKFFKDFTNHRKKTDRAVVFSSRPFPKILKYRATDETFQESRKQELQMKCCIRLKNWGFLWDVRHVLLHSAVTFFNRRHPKHGIKENFCSNKVLNIISFNVLLTGQKLRAMPITYGTKPSAFHMVTFPKFSGSTLHGSNTKGLIHLSSCLQFGLNPPEVQSWFAISLHK